MKLSNISTDCVNVSEIGIHELVVHEGRLAMFLGYDNGNQLAQIQYLDPGIDIQLVSVTPDCLMNKVVSVTIQQ